jgi:von Willebrand factor type D domain
MRPRLALILLAVFLLGGGVLWYVRRPQSPASSTAATATPAASTAEASTQAKLLSDIITKGVTPDRAKQYFSLAVAPLPGVPIDGMTHDPTDFDGTAAVYYLRQVWASLTADQKKAAHDAMVGTGGRASQRSAIGQPRLLIAGFASSADDPAHDYVSLENNANNAIAQAMGVPAVPIRTVVLMNTASEFAHSQSWPDNSDQPFDDGKCWTIVHDTKFIALDDISTASIMAHEAMHCYQDRAAGTGEARSRMPQWVAEGEATWAEATIVPSATDIIASKWTSYLFYPKTAFYFRAYDAVGVFGHAGDLNGPSLVWTRMMSVAALSTQQQSDAVLKAEIAGFSDRYFSSWGASYFRDSRDPWRITGPGLAMSGRPEPDKITLGQGDLKVLAAGQYEATQTNVETSEDILEVALVQGYGRVHDASFAIDTALDTGAPLTLCVRLGGCACPPDSEGKVPDTQKASTPISIGLDGGDDAIARVGLATRSLDEFCKRKKKPTPPPDPGGGGGGGGGVDDADQTRNPQNGHSVGDPHLRTFDGVPFDFQRIGEYTLVKSTKDDFVVQVRQIPVPGSRAVAVNQAMATKIGGKRITVTLEENHVVLRADGVAVTGDPPLLTDGSIMRSISGFGTKYTFEWPDGTIVTAGQVSHFALNVGVKPSASRKGALEGLFGNDDGALGNDDVDSAALASKWLVPASASLFDYAPGQSSDTFVDPTFPDPTATVPNREAAEKACREEGITDATLLHNCVIDFGITNGFLFADQYAQQQAVLRARFATTAPKGSVAAMRVLKLAGPITDAAHPPQVTFDAAPGDVIYLGRPDCSDVVGDRKVFVNVVDPNGKYLGGSAGCDIGRVDLPVAGKYTVKAVRPLTGDGLDVPIRFVRHDRVGSVKYGDIVSGNIEQRGAHDRYAFTAQSGDVIQIYGPGCDLGNMFISFVDAAGHDALGPICREGFATKIRQSGTYTLLVNSGDGGPGAYHFVFQGVSGK